MEHVPKVMQNVRVPTPTFKEYLHCIASNQHKTKDWHSYKSHFSELERQRINEMERENKVSKFSQVMLI